MGVLFPLSLLVHSCPIALIRVLCVAIGLPILSLLPPSICAATALGGFRPPIARQSGSRAARFIADQVIRAQGK